MDKDKEQDKERYDKLMKLLESRFDKIEKTLNSMVQVREVLNGEEYLDNQDLCILFGVTKRTLARYRKMNKINFYRMGGKNFYKASEIKHFLKNKEEQESGNSSSSEE